jgi:hypothetical protein
MDVKKRLESRDKESDVGEKEERSNHKKKNVLI